MFIRLPLDSDEVMDAVRRDDGTGFCISCGSEHSCCEPDARGYDCEDCGESHVYGAEEIIIMGLI